MMDTSQDLPHVDRRVPFDVGITLLSLFKGERVRVVTTTGVTAPAWSGIGYVQAIEDDDAEDGTILATDEFIVRFRNGDESAFWAIDPDGLTLHGSDADTSITKVES